MLQFTMATRTHTHACTHTPTHVCTHPPTHPYTHTHTHTGREGEGGTNNIMHIFLLGAGHGESSWGGPGRNEGGEVGYSVMSMVM